MRTGKKAEMALNVFTPALAAMNARFRRSRHDGRFELRAPPHWHKLQAIAACQAGKNIYLPNPMTLHLAESLVIDFIARHNGLAKEGKYG